MLRPASTRWFEVLSPRGETVRTVAALAATGAVELEVRAAEDFPVGHLATPLREYQTLSTRYGRYWSRGTLHQRPLAVPPETALRRTLAHIAAWRQEADPLIERLQAFEEEATRLQWLDQIIGKIAESSLDFGAVARSGPVLGTFCCILPADAQPQLPDWVIPRWVPWEDQRCYMILGPRDRLDPVKQQVQSLNGRIIERPPWLRGDARDSLERIGARRAFLSVQVVNLYAELDSLFDDYDLGLALGEVSQLTWFAEHVGGLELAGTHLDWITGWTDDLRGSRLIAALERHRCRAILRLRRPPVGLRPPQVLDNPPWMRPFEVFARVFGVPGDSEADPTPLLSVIVPLLFGYMFGDLGQGAILAGAGWWLARRGFAMAPLLILGGLAAMGFGVLFGSVFSREDLIPALWLRPLEDPVMVLLVPLIFAIGLLSLGQLLAGLGAWWRGELGDWLGRDLGLLILYLGLIGLPLHPDLGWLAGLGAVWYLLGSLLIQRRLLGVLSAAGHLLESGAQLLVNTLSFARVGAFALAHAALSAAIVTMANTAPLWGGALILIGGNALIIALEGLVVSIQTTRLVLFEFFNRFLRGTGRVFRPLPPPPAIVTSAG